MLTGNIRKSESPSYTQDMRPGFWYCVSGDSPDLGLSATPFGSRYLEDNDPARDPKIRYSVDLKERVRRSLGRRWIAPWSGGMGFPAITEAWNGAVYASRFGPAGSMVVFGGGHTDYFGSDVHAFDLASRKWRRLTTGYVTGKRSEYGEGAIYRDSVYPDGSPLPPHTYDYAQYDEVSNTYLLLKGQIELGSNVTAVAIPHLFDLGTLSWRRGPKHESAILNSGGFTTWDAKRRLLWGHSGDDGGGNAFVGYCPDGANDDGTSGYWQEFHPNKMPGQANHNSMQIHVDLDLIAVASHAKDCLLSIDPRDPGGEIATITSVGDRPRIRPYAALEFSTGRGVLIYYSASDGAATFAVEWDGEARWSLLSDPASLNPVADAAAQTRHHLNRTHTLGRFRIASFDDIDLAVLVRHVDSPVYAMRLPL